MIVVLNMQLAGLFIFNIFLYKYVEARNLSQTITMRFVIGICFACLSMCTRGIVKRFRQQECDDRKFSVNQL